MIWKRNLRKVRKILLFERSNEENGLLCEEKAVDKNESWWIIVMDKETIKDVTVSVVIAVYNMERYLRYCINSVLEQTYEDYEIVLVNDGSTDSSEQIIDEYIAKYPKKVRKINKTNGGQSSARNIALPRIHGRYVTFLDADDYYDKEYLKNLVQKAESENLDMVVSGQYKVTVDGKIIKTIHYSLKNGQTSQRRLNISGKLYRTEYIQRWNITFPEGKLYEDNSFNLQAYFLSDKIGFLEYEGYYQVVHEGSTTANSIDASILPFEEWKMVCKKIKESNVKGVDLELFDFTFVSFITYFLIVRNRKREYLPNKNRDKSMKSVWIIVDEFEKMICDNFNKISTNKYCSLIKNRDIAITQKIGVSILGRFANKKKLKVLVSIIYRKSYG